MLPYCARASTTAARSSAWKPNSTFDFALLLSTANFPHVPLPASASRFLTVGVCTQVGAARPLRSLLQSLGALDAQSSKMPESCSSPWEIGSAENRAGILYPYSFLGHYPDILALLRFETCSRLNHRGEPFTWESRELGRVEMLVRRHGCRVGGGEAKMFL